MSRAPCSPISVMRSRCERPLAVRSTTSPGSSARRLGRQRELGALAGGPGLEQPHLGDLGGLLGIEHERQIGERHATAAAGEAARFLHGCGVVAAGGDVGDLGGDGQVRLLRAGEGGERSLGAGLDQVVGGEVRGRIGGAAVGEDDLAVALARVEEEGELQRLEVSRADSTRSTSEAAEARR